jgi:hypothetical protein
MQAPQSQINRPRGGWSMLGAHRIARATRTPHDRAGASSSAAWPLLYRAAVVLAGCGALALALAGGSPLAMLAGAVYGLLIPAWLLRALVMKYLPQLQPPIAALALVPAVLMGWVVVLATLWLLGLEPTGMATLAGTAAVMTALLLWRVPRLPALDLRSAVTRHAGDAIAVLVGLLIGALMVALVSLR